MQLGVNEMTARTLGAAGMGVDLLAFSSAALFIAVNCFSNYHTHTKKIEICVHHAYVDLTDLWKLIKYSKFHLSKECL